MNPKLLKDEQNVESTRSTEKSQDVPPPPTSPIKFVKSDDHTKFNTDEESNEKGSQEQLKRLVERKTYFRSLRGVPYF